MFDKQAYMQKYNKAYKQDHREYFKNHNKLYRQKHRLRFKALNLKQYGLTIQSFSELIERQNNVCKLCEQPFAENVHALNPVVDHDHFSGKIRGLLHRKCNFAIGLLGDNLSGVQKAVDYLVDSMLGVD